MGTVMAGLAMAITGDSGEKFALLWFVVCPIICAAIAWKKQRSILKWGIVGLFAGFIGVALLLLMPASHAKGRRSG